MPAASAKKIDRRRGRYRSARYAEVEQTPPRRIANGQAWLSIGETARRLEISPSLLYRIIRTDAKAERLAKRRRLPVPERTLTVNDWPVNGRMVTYATLASVEAYRNRRDAWKAMHGRA